MGGERVREWVGKGLGSAWERVREWVGKGLGSGWGKG